jgi:hypothetical protein
MPSVALYLQPLIVLSCEVTVYESDHPAFLHAFLGSDAKMRQDTQR